MLRRALLLLAAPALGILPGIVRAQETAPSLLHYRWTPGQTLRYIVLRDPYFANPAALMKTAEAEAADRPPVVERLTEQVLSVADNGTATLKLTLGPEPGFEDEATPQPPLTQTVMVSATGEILGSTPRMPTDLQAALFRLPDTPAAWQGGLAIVTAPPSVTVSRSTSPDHDGTLLQTTQVQRADRAIYDVQTGSLRRRVITLTGTLSLVMTQRGRRGAADFGRVVPRLPFAQTLTVDWKEALPPPAPALSAPSPASTERQSKN